MHIPNLSDSKFFNLPKLFGMTPVISLFPSVQTIWIEILETFAFLFNISTKKV